jgi:hypothetical protein
MSPYFSVDDRKTEMTVSKRLLEPPGKFAGNVRKLYCTIQNFNKMSPYFSAFNRKTI